MLHVCSRKSRVIRKERLKYLPNSKVGVHLGFLNARYYQGSRGQFLSQDPVFWELGMSQEGQTALRNPQAQNSYSYAVNNPLLFSDPSGRWFQLGGSIVAGYRALSAGIRFDTQGIDVYFGGGVGLGLQAGFELGWAPDQKGDHDSREVSVSGSASAAHLLGAEVSFDALSLNTKTQEASGPKKPYMAVVLGEGASVKFQEQVTQPIVKFSPSVARSLDHGAKVADFLINPTPTKILSVAKQIQALQASIRLLERQQAQIRAK